MSEVIYRLQGVRKSYGEQLILQINELEIKWGEVLALDSPSGAGKCTLLRLLNFLEPPSQGVIAFMETEFSASKPIPLDLRRHVFQAPATSAPTVAPAAAPTEPPAAPPDTQSAANYALRIMGKVDKQLGWTEDQIHAMPTMEAQSTNKQGETSTYTGVLLTKLLDEAGLQRLHPVIPQPGWLQFRAARFPQQRSSEKCH